MIDLVDSLAITIGFAVILAVLFGPSIYSAYLNRKMRRSLDDGQGDAGGTAGNGVAQEKEERSPSPR